MILKDIQGDWKLTESVNADEYLKALGISFFMRKLANSVKPDVSFVSNGDEYSFTTSSTIKTHSIRFKLDQEFDEETIDGRNVKVLDFYVFIYLNFV